MTHTELNKLPHRSKTDLDAIPSISLVLVGGAFAGSKMRLFDATETSEGWTGCVRLPVTGDFAPRRLYSRNDYRGA